MESRVVKRKIQRDRRLLRVRKKVRGTAERPRMCVVKTNKHLSIQVINDEAMTTLCSASTMTADMIARKLGRKSKESARQLGVQIAEKAKSQNIQSVVFDRGSCRYHGLLAELANAAREAGLQF